MSQIATSTSVRANDVQNLIAFSYDQSELNKLIAPFKTASASDSARVDAEGFAVYMQLRVSFPTFPKPSTEFRGRGGGLLTSGAGFDIGELHYIDRARLFTDAVGFTFAFFAPHHQIWFWDGSSNLLAYFEGLGALNLNGVGGGTGSWSVP